MPATRWSDMVWVPHRTPTRKLPPCTPPPRPNAGERAQGPMLHVYPARRMPHRRFFCRAKLRPDLPQSDLGQPGGKKPTSIPVASNPPSFLPCDACFLSRFLIFCSIACQVPPASHSPLNPAPPHFRNLIPFFFLLATSLPAGTNIFLIRRGLHLDFRPQALCANVGNSATGLPPPA
ncbi:hypothetical protein METBIDRAFT_165330 [Metschnikowia bicuspidata var. bicuspidata NRRL YB-4993]|uniref:Uncharacterized protein n=1 Tax=Metschnikowia bicuspidata var. bicuspidata NRRL YB-4993 TaxID=869754 RepID=A0A1A0H9S5_9ASCO|nr:hypothetical protein METBIDRAFT_165330 [Metschnikowia bicuspidata var. bicuspidata NRRL YB-4993]OBA20879.1 hypothetical protein METBIDRAFT_165330 [Metschnikowia bicuspidata var. bicuspidata NRRL YB-4993]